MDSEAQAKVPGKEQVVEVTPFESPIDWSKYAPKPQHVYEGTDTEDDEIITSRRPDASTLNRLMPKLDIHGKKNT